MKKKGLVQHKDKVVIWGASGHAKVVAEIIDFKTMNLKESAFWMTLMLH